MQITKTMRDYVESILTEKRRKLDNEMWADYRARVKNAHNAISKVLENKESEVVAILKANNMDYSNVKQVISCYIMPLISNAEEDKRLGDIQRARYEKQKVMIRDLTLECELGMNKERFLAAIATLNFD